MASAASAKILPFNRDCPDQFRTTLPRSPRNTRQLTGSTPRALTRNVQLSDDPIVHFVDFN
jgi:hypothetical protein